MRAMRAAHAEDLRWPGASPAESGREGVSSCAEGDSTPSRRAGSEALNVVWHRLGTEGGGAEETRDLDSQRGSEWEEEPCDGPNRESVVATKQTLLRDEG